MTERIIVQIIEIIFAATTTAGIAVIFVATWHDLRSIARKSRLQSIASNLTKIKQLPVAILIYTHNNATSLKECLKSITANNYERYSIIIADNASSDATLDIVAEYEKTHPDIPIILHSQKTYIDRASLLRVTSKKASNHELLLLLNATDQLSNSSLRSIVAHFIADRRLDTLRIRQHITQDIAIGTLSAYFASLTKNILRKALSWRRVARNDIYRNGTVVRTTALSTTNRPARLSARYGSQITFTAKDQQCTQAWNPLTLLAVTIVLIAGVSMITYFFLTAATLRSNALLTVSWAIVSLWLFAIIWSDEILDVSKKITLTFTIPFAYFLLYVQLFVGLIKKIRRLIGTISLPKVNFNNIHNALLQEAYSTRF